MKGNTSSSSTSLQVFRACTALPRTVFLTGDVLLHLVGCSLAPATMQLELVMCFEAAGNVREQRVVTTHFMQPRLENLVPRLSVQGCECGSYSFRQHVVTLNCVCNNVDNLTAPLVLGTGRNSSKHMGVEDIVLTRLLELRTKPFRVHGRLLACNGQAVYGDLEQRLRMVQKAQLLWLAEGFQTTIMFAPNASTCNALSRVPGTACELRGALAPARRIGGSSNSGRQQIYEQPVLNAVCLAYARAAGAQFLALADTDDFAPAGLPRVLDAIQAHGGIGGVRLFFDADMSCPRLFCPRNESDWLSRCRRGTAYADGVRAPKNHWKPIVIPSRTSEVAVHQFWPSPPYLRKQVWSICYLHRAAPSPTESDTEQDQFELRRTMIGPGGSDLSLLV